MRTFVSRFFSPSVLLFAVLFLLPLQTRWIIHPGTLNNLYWEYGTVSLYGTDILILLFIASVFLPKLKIYSLRLSKGNVLRTPVGGLRLRSGNTLLPTFYLLLPAITVWSFLSIIWSADHGIALYQSLKLLEGVLLFAATRRVFSSQLSVVRSAPASDSQTYNLQLTTYSFTAAAFLQSVLAIQQFFTQNVQANKWLGVALHDPGQSGAAVVETALRRWLRAYGTLPHPNILGEFLLVGLLFYIGWLLIASPRWKERAMHAPTNAKFFFWSLVCSLGLWVPYAILVAGLFFTFSRAAWLAFFLSLALLFVVQAKRSTYNLQLTTYKLLGIAVLVFALLGTVYNDPVSARLTGAGRLETKSIMERIEGYTRARDAISRHPFIGTGIGNSSLTVSQELEKNIPAEIRARSLEAATPVHNTPLMVFVELGFIGGLLYLTFLASLLRYIVRSTLARERSETYSLQLTTYCALLLLTLFDHSFWTLHPSQMLFWSIAGLASISDAHPDQSRGHVFV